jgi:hypothetical protein
MSTPASGDPVRLILPELGTLAALVETVEETELTVRLPTGHAIGERTGATIEFTTALGLCRMPGTVEPAGRPGTLRFRGEGRMEREQRREHVRADASRPVALFAEDDGTAGSLATYTVNVSGSGLLVAGPGSLIEGQQVDFRLALGEGEAPIDAIGRVTRITADGHRGIAIEQISPGDRERLIHFVFERERRARREANLQ